jgi:hypothetical protein
MTRSNSPYAPSPLILGNIELRICTLAVLSALEAAVSRYTRSPTGTPHCARDDHTHTHRIDTHRASAYAAIVAEQS